MFRLLTRYIHSKVPNIRQTVVSSKRRRHLCLLLPRQGPQRAGEAGVVDIA